MTAPLPCPPARVTLSFIILTFPDSKHTIPHGKVEHKARSILDPALYSERYIKQNRLVTQLFVRILYGRAVVWGLSTPSLLLTATSSFDHLLSRLYWRLLWLPRFFTAGRGGCVGVGWWGCRYIYFSLTCHGLLVPQPAVVCCSTPIIPRHRLPSQYRRLCSLRDKFGWVCRSFSWKQALRIRWQGGPSRPSRLSFVCSGGMVVTVTFLLGPT